MNCTRLKMLCIIVTVCCCPSAYSQSLQLVLKQPPPGRLGVQDLWSIQALSLSTAPVVVVLHGEVHESTDGEVYVVESGQLTIKPGTTRFMYGDIPSPRILKSVPKYQNTLQRTGKVPAGTYLYCLKALAVSNRAELATSCITQNIVALSSPILLAPENNSIISPKGIQFSWLPPSPQTTTPMRYSLRIVPMYSTQTKEVAMERNAAWFTTENITQPSFLFPLSARTLQPKQRYAWMVSGDNGTENVTSEVFDFTVATSDVTIHSGTSSSSDGISGGNKNDTANSSVSTITTLTSPCKCGDITQTPVQKTISRNGRAEPRVHEQVIEGDRFSFKAVAVPTGFCDPASACKPVIKKWWEVTYYYGKGRDHYSKSKDGDEFSLVVPDGITKFIATYYHSMRCGSELCLSSETSDTFHLRQPCCERIRAMNAGRLLWHDQKGNVLELNGNKALITVDGQEFDVQFSDANLEHLFCSLEQNQIVSALQDKKSSISHNGQTKENASTQSALITAPTSDIPEMSPEYLVQFAGQIIHGDRTESFSATCSINRENCEFMIFFTHSVNEQQYVSEYFSSPFMTLAALNKAIKQESDDPTRQSVWDAKMRDMVSGLLQWETWIKSHDDSTAIQKYQELRKAYLAKLCIFIIATANNDNPIRRELGIAFITQARQRICNAVNDTSISMHDVALLFMKFWTASRSLPNK